jgi:hypothetical protein
MMNSIIGNIHNSRPATNIDTTFCGQDFLDIQVHSSYTLTPKKEVLINSALLLKVVEGFVQLF